MINYTKKRDKIKKFTENRRTFSLQNPEQRCFGYVKGESTTEASGQKRCDYIICFDFGKDDNNPLSPTNYLFVELKGSDNEKALEQIVSTIQYFLQKGIIRGKHADCFVVSGSCPTVKTQEQILKAKFLYGNPPYNYKLQFKTRLAEYKIEI